VLLGLACGGEETPNRNYYPVIQKQVYALQEAIKNRSRAAIDSLATVELLDLDLNSDSLLKYVYGPGNDYAFDVLGNVSIVYTDEKARVDCFIMDSTRARDRPITFTFIRDDTLWLMKRFEETPKDTASDSLAEM
jgi:hypothetical protein